MVDQSPPRRTVMKVGATALAAPLIAGCGGSSDDDGTGGETDEPANGGGTGGTKSFDGWFENTSNYDGVTDKTGSDAVTVKVGTGDKGYLFSPPAISVDVGTTVTWKWTGKGGSHNVQHEDGAFKSDLTDEKGHTFKHTFDKADTYRYFCQPHKALGMRGVVVVKE